MTNNKNCQIGLIYAINDSLGCPIPITDKLYTYSLCFARSKHSIIAHFCKYLGDRQKIKFRLCDQHFQDFVKWKPDNVLGNDRVFEYHKKDEDSGTITIRMRKNRL